MIIYYVEYGEDQSCEVFGTKREAMNEISDPPEGDYVDHIMKMRLMNKHDIVEQLSFFVRGIRGHLHHEIIYQADPEKG